MHSFKKDALGVILKGHTPRQISQINPDDQWGDRHHRIVFTCRNFELGTFPGLATRSWSSLILSLMLGGGGNNREIRGKFDVVAWAVARRFGGLINAFFF